MSTHLPEPRRAWSRYVAIGDSFSEGMSEPHPSQPDRYVGWADRLAVLLGGEAQAAGTPFGYANLAIRGRLLADVVGPQLDAALALQPDLVSLVGGGNDLLRPGVDPDSIAARLEAAVERITATGADVLLATPVDPAEAGLLAPLRGRHGIHTSNLFTIAQRHGCFVLNLWGLRALRDWRLWATDRIHLTGEGHRRVALAAFSALGFETDPDDWRRPMPPGPAAGALAAARADAQWAAQYVAPWVKRRLTGRSSGDHVSPKRPALLPVDDLRELLTTS